MIVRTGKPGTAAVVPNHLTVANCSDLVIVRPGPHLDSRFLCYYLNGLAGSFVDGHLIGAVQQHFNVGAARLLPIRLPSICEQRRIGSLLGALDDKIELNRQMNETLEAMARALFKSWFVDFDPVRAKMEGRAPFGMDAATAALFPDKMALSDDATLPVGWRREPLAHWADAWSGGTPSMSKPALWSGDIPWISPKVMTSIHADEADAFVSRLAVGAGTRLAPAGATLVMVRGMALHSFVRVSQARRELTFNQDVKALVPREIAPSLLLFSMLHAQPELLTKVESSGHGTGKLPTEILMASPIVMPQRDVQAELARNFDLFTDRIAAARAESETLAQLRDLLLPKLLSGELRIRDAERAVEAVL